MTIIPVGFTYALTITAVTLFGIFKYNQTQIGTRFKLIILSYF